MPPRNYDNRRVEVYFGPPGKVDVTKEELAEFIIEDIGLERSDGAPKWTEGVGRLVKLGMDAFQEQYQDERDCSGVIPSRRIAHYRLRDPR